MVSDLPLLNRRMVRGTRLPSKDKNKITDLNGKIIFTSRSSQNPNKHFRDKIGGVGTVREKTREIPNSRIRGSNGSDCWREVHRYRSRIHEYRDEKSREKVSSPPQRLPQTCKGNERMVESISKCYFQQFKVVLKNLQNRTHTYTCVHISPYPVANLLNKTVYLMEVQEFVYLERYKQLKNLFVIQIYYSYPYVTLQSEWTEIHRQKVKGGGKERYKKIISHPKN